MQIRVKWKLEHSQPGKEFIEKREGYKGKKKNYFKFYLKKNTKITLRLVTNKIAKQKTVQNGQKKIV